MLDYSALLYDPVYIELGVPCLFVSGAIEADLTVIDDTRPKILPAGSAEVRSVGPGAFVRIPELERNGISRDDWMDATLSFNGRSWVVRSYELRGSPNGEDAGEVRFLLKAVEVVIPPDGGGAYVAKAVHFDGLTYLTTDTGVSDDSTLISFSLWVKAPSLPDPDMPAAVWLLFDFDPPGRESGVYIPAHIDHPGSLSSIWSIPGGHTSRTGGVGYNDGVFTAGHWHHIFGYVDTASANVIYVDGVDVSANTTIGDGFILPFSTKGWAIPDSTDDWEPPFFTGDYADVWIAPGVMETDITKFRDAVTGKPKDPSGFPSSSILFSGDASTFAINQGTGGAFTLTGALTNATISPSDG